MRVLLVSDFYPPRPGGLEAHVARLGAQLSARGHTVCVATVGGTGGGEHPGPVEVHELALSLAKAPGIYQAGRPFHPPWADRRFSRSLQGVAGQFQPDVVHAHGWSLFSAVPVARRAGIPLVATLHDYGLLCPTKSLSCGGAPCRTLAGLCCVSCRDCDQGPVKRTGLAAALRLGRAQLNGHVDQFLAVSCHVADQHLRGGIGTADTVSVVPNFVDLDDVTPTGVPAGGPVLFVGPDASYKGTELTQAAYARLPAARRNGLRLVGGTAGPTVDGVERTGRLAGDRLWAQFRASSVAAVTPLWADPCPTVALEAMALGRPVVATAVGGLTDIVDDETTGLLVPAGDVAALSSAFNRLLADPELSQLMGSAAKQRVTDRFSAAAVVPQIESAYRRAAQ